MASKKKKTAAKRPPMPQAYNPIAALPGVIRVSYPMGGSGFKGSESGYMSIRVTDEASRAVMFEVSVDMAHIGEMIASRGQTPCRYVRGALDLAGKVREVKTEVVPRPRTGADDDELAKLLAPYEVDGWRASDDDARNHHNWRGDDKVAVTFWRYVDSPHTTELMAAADAVWNSRHDDDG